MTEKNNNKLIGSNEIENLHLIETCILVNELGKREGVNSNFAEPYETKTITVIGPARILIIVD